MRKRKSDDDWICNEFPNCTCGRASRYTTQPLYRYTTGANGPGNIARELRDLALHQRSCTGHRCKTMALAQLLHPKFDTTIRSKRSCDMASGGYEHERPRPRQSPLLPLRIR